MKQLLVEYLAAEMQLSMFMLQAHPGLEASSLSFSFWTVSLLSNLDVTTVILAEHLEKARQLWFSDLLNWGFCFFKWEASQYWGCKAQNPIELLWDYLNYRFFLLVSCAIFFRRTWKKYPLAFHTEQKSYTSSKINLKMSRCGIHTFVLALLSSLWKR